jgi:alpha-tubulin suppressor-like RCC1 family protein
MRHFSLFGRHGRTAGRGRRAAAAAALAGFGAFAGLLPAQTAQASEWHRPLMFRPASEIYGNVPTGQVRELSGIAAVSHLVFTPASYDYGEVPAGEGATGYTAQVDAAAAADHATLPLTGTGTGTTAQAQSVLAGGNHNCAVKTDHTLWCWGNNFSGQLGDGTTTNSPVPVQVSGHSTDWVTVSPGGDDTCAVKTDHTLWCWGLNYAGQLGDGTTTNSPVPVQVSGHSTDWATVSPGQGYTCAVKTGGTVWCWGVNGSGQLGDGTTTDSQAPVQVSGHTADWASVTAGGAHTCAEKTDRTVWCWGVNGNGELGNGATTNSPVPVQVSGHTADWASVTAGQDYTCAEKTGGTVWCWGVNGLGQLGDGTTTDSPVPVQVGGHTADWASVTAGWAHTCAIKTDHTLWCWGDNGFGQLGDGTTTASPVQVQVSGHTADWATVSDGLSHTCAEKTDGTVWCWGWNIDGQLGDGTTTNSSVPVQVSGI